MGYSPSALENSRHLLSGFNWATLTSLGDIVLPVQASPVTLNVQFLVVNDMSLYNAIMGHAWLNIMKSIPSTYHEMVSSLMEEGQAGLLGSQLATRQCYQVALDFGHLADEEAHMESSNTREQYQLLSLAKKHPSAVDPLQPLCLSHGKDKITYTSSLLTQNELELLWHVL